MYRRENHIGKEDGRNDCRKNVVEVTCDNAEHPRQHSDADKYADNDQRA